MNSSEIIEELEKKYEFQSTKKIVLLVLRDLRKKLAAYYKLIQDEMSKLECNL